MTPRELTQIRSSCLVVAIGRGRSSRLAALCPHRGVVALIALLILRRARAPSPRLRCMGEDPCEYGTGGPPPLTSGHSTVGKRGCRGRSSGVLVSCPQNFSLSKVNLMPTSGQRFERAVLRERWRNILQHARTTLILGVLILAIGGAVAYLEATGRRTSAGYPRGQDCEYYGKGAFTCYPPPK